VNELVCVGRVYSKFACILVAWEGQFTLSKDPWYCCTQCCTWCT